jgi:hypothetical protein
MEGPRPASRHRPADFSASFAPLDHLPGPGTLPALRSTGSPGGSGAPRADGSGFPLCQQARGFPQAGRLRVFPQPVAQSFLSPNDRGFPQVKRLKFSLRRWLRAFRGANKTLTRLFMVRHQRTGHPKTWTLCQLSNPIAGQTNSRV